MKIFSGRDLHRTVEELVGAPVSFDSDANASLLQVLTDDASIHDTALLSVSSTLNFATCRDRELARGRTPAFGDIGSLSSGIDDRTLNGLLSTAGLVKFVREHGLDLERVEGIDRETGGPSARTHGSIGVRQADASVGSGETRGC